MKSLKDVLSSEIEFGISALSEKLILTNDIKLKNIKTKTLFFEIPEIDDTTGKLSNDGTIVGTLDIPNFKYFIYKDKYRFNKYHLADLGDMMFSITYNWQHDFEDFDVKKDIVYYSNDEQDIIKWYIENILKVQPPKQNEEFHDWITNNKIKSIYHYNAYDSLEFLYDIYQGNDHITEFGDKIKNSKDLRDLMMQY